MLFAVAIALWLAPGVVSSPEQVAGVARVVIVLSSAAGAVIPDADLRFKHRKALHNIFAPLVLAAALSYVFQGVTLAELAVTWLFIGWISHIALDVITVKGVYLFYPFYRRAISIGLCRSDSLFWNLALSALSLALIALKAGKTMMPNVFPFQIYQSTFSWTLCMLGNLVACLQPL